MHAMQKKNEDVSINIKLAEPLNGKCYAFVLVHIIKYLLYTRHQIPSVYDTLCMLINKNKHKYELNSKGIVRCKSTKLFRTASNTLETIDTILKNVTSEICKNKADICEIAVLFGATPVSAKEIFLIKWNSIYDEQGQDSELDRTTALLVMQKTLRTLGSNEGFQQVLAQKMQTTNTYVLIKKLQSLTESSSSFFLPKDKYEIPSRSQTITINILAKTDCRLNVHTPNIVDNTIGLASDPLCCNDSRAKNGINKQSPTRDSECIITKLDTSLLINSLCSTDSVDVIEETKLTVNGDMFINSKHHVPNDYLFTNSKQNMEKFTNITGDTEQTELNKNKDLVTLLETKLMCSNSMFVCTEDFNGLVSNSLNGESVVNKRFIKNSPSEKYIDSECVQGVVDKKNLVSEETNVKSSIGDNESFGEKADKSRSSRSLQFTNLGYDQRTLDEIEHNMDSVRLHMDHRWIWFQSSEIIKGFRDDLVNGKSIWNPV